MTDINTMWHLLPLVIAISLVWGATRHEVMQPILIQSWRAFRWITSFVFVIFVLVYVASMFT